MLNAYADGAKIVITTAMMEFAAKDEELANIIAHEYAHNVMRHIDSKKGNAILGTLAGMAIDAAIGGGGNAASQLGGNIGAGSYSVDFEKEADYVGLYIFARTGYDPNQAIQFWRKMSQADEMAIDTGVTHPTNPERFVAMKKTIAEINYKQQNGLRLVPEFRK
jgi:predicted Zn-dependent protease